MVSANGGDGRGWAGGGAGGRIAFYYTSSDRSDANTTMYGGGGSSYGGAGTFYKKPSAQTYGDLIIDNGDRFNVLDGYMGRTPLGTETLNVITLQNYGNLNITATTNVTYSSLTWSNQGIITDNGGTFALVSGGGKYHRSCNCILFGEYSKNFHRTNRQRNAHPYTKPYYSNLSD